MNSKLIMIGYWNSLSVGKWVHPRVLIDENWEVDNRDKIISYLDNGMLYSCSFGFSPNRFFKGPKNMGDHEKTDGVWVWPSGLSDYVETYKIRLPDSFIDHMKKRNFIPATNKDEKDKPWFENEHDKELDFSYWEQWCKSEKKKLNFLKRCILNFSHTL